MLVKQYGAGKVDEVSLRSFRSRQPEYILTNAGDTQATLTGARLDEVAGESERHPLCSGRALARTIKMN
jgi:hypothetical protein